MRPYAYLVGGGLACAHRRGERARVTCEQVGAHVFVRTHSCLKYVTRYDFIKTVLRVILINLKQRKIK